MTRKIAEDIVDAIHSVMHLHRSLQYRSLRDSPHELTHMEFKVLAFFARHPEATQRDLVTRTGRDKAQIARLIRGLRDRALLEGSADPDDKRSIRLRLTEAGNRTYSLVESQGEQLTNVAVNGLSEDECQQLAGLLERLRANLDAERRATTE